jgi:SNF2 family DNA or RNA helicase
MSPTPAADDGPVIRSWPVSHPVVAIQSAPMLTLMPAEISHGVEPDLLLAPPTIQSQRWDAAQVQLQTLATRKPRLRLKSFVFGARAEDAQATGKGPAEPTTSKPVVPAERPMTPGTTRLDIPADVVKLADRLHYVLQPPLETWLSRQHIELPFEPFPYQLEGVAFLYPRSAAILADEMGLGKTMQSITALRLLMRSREIENALLICPKPLVANWQRELQLWASELPVVVIEGDQARRRWQWQLPGTALKIANYEILARDRELLTDGTLQFDLVVLDESQRIKNSSSATARVVQSIPRKRSWALTGTPVENSAADLVGIFEFLAPGHLSADMKLHHLGQAAHSYVLRRTKDRVLKDLPPKMFRDADLELTPEQRESYRLAEEEGVLRLTEMGEAVTIQHVFELVLRLKQICNFDPATGQSVKLERLEADLEEVAASGQKAIVFSQYVDTLTTLAERLAEYRPLEFHGRIPSAEREPILEEFRHADDRPLLLLSYGAGGVGLNLQFASYVFLYDRWWNPAIEDQAINRAHRIGAAGPVTVSRFLVMNTIEQRIDQVLRDKREIFDAIFSDAEPHRALGLKRSEIFGLFNLRSPSGPLEIEKAA